jgi:hypothetical protein
MMLSVSANRLGRRLVAAARAYVAGGWPVAPGAWWEPDEARYRCGLPGCMTEGLHPTVPEAADASGRCWITVNDAATHEIGAVSRQWGQRPHSVLLPTGHTVDALELGAAVASRLQALLAARGKLGPFARFPDGTALLFTTVAEAADAQQAANFATAGALHHGRGSWVPLPPTQLAEGPIRWIRSPGATLWRLPSLRSVTDALRLALLPMSAGEVAARQVRGRTLGL